MTMMVLGNIIYTYEPTSNLNNLQDSGDRKRKRLVSLAGGTFDGVACMYILTT